MMHHEIHHPTGWGWDFLAKETLPILDGEGPRMFTETLRPPKLRWSLVHVSPIFLGVPGVYTILVDVED